MKEQERKEIVILTGLKMLGMRYLCRDEGSESLFAFECEPELHYEVDNDGMTTYMHPYTWYSSGIGNGFHLVSFKTLFEDVTGEENFPSLIDDMLAARVREKGLRELTNITSCLTKEIVDILTDVIET